jgi:hypothetical protein
MLSPALKTKKAKNEKNAELSGNKQRASRSVAGLMCMRHGNDERANGKWK